MTLLNQILGAVTTELARWWWCKGDDAIVVCQVNHHPNNSKSPKPPPPSILATHPHPHLTQLIRFHKTPHQKPISKPDPQSPNKRQAQIATVIKASHS